MISPYKIYIQVPNYEKQDRSFGFRLHSTPTVEPCEYRMPSRIFVVSDIEGNFVSFFKLLVAAKVISTKMEWIFENNHLVILGDCFDRGDQVTECLWLIYSLEEKAKRFGGHVHFILGNHEIMNMNGDWRYIHPRYALLTSSENNPPTALYHGNLELWKWLQTKNIIERIGYVLFVHAGISREILNLQLSIQEINDLVRPWYGKAAFAEQFSLQLSMLFDAYTSPFWYRGYYMGNADKDLIGETLKFYNSKIIITGHTMINQITPFFKKKVININTDHSTGSSEGLLITKRGYYRVNQKVIEEKIE